MKGVQMDYPVYTNETAPEASRSLLDKAKKSIGFVPNLLGMMAGAPPLLEAYMAVSSLFDQTSFSATERQVILLAVSFQNQCDYCMAAHSAIGGMQRVPGDVIESLRKGTPITDQKLEVLRRLAVEITETKGRPADATVNDFLAAGYTRAQVLEVVLGVGMKTLSNYANHIAETPLDGAFAKTAWKAASHSPGR
jgi:uncharacterized peroxidase-related enzyme